MAKKSKKGGGGTVKQKTPVVEEEEKNQVVESLVERSQEEPVPEPIEILSEAKNNGSGQSPAAGGSNDEVEEELRKEISQLKLLVSQNEETASKERELLKNELLETTAAKENAEQQYESLLEKISHIKSTLGARLKSDAEELSAYKEEISQLEEDKRSLTKSIQSLQGEAISANKESDQLSHQLSQIRNEFQTKMQEWSKEREGLVKDKRSLQERFEKSESMVRDLEIAIADDHSLKENANFRISGLEEQIMSQTNYAERYRTERDELKANLQEVEKRLENKSLEFSEKLMLLENDNQLIQEKLENTTRELSASVNKVAHLEQTARTVSQLEEEVKEKVLLIGKLRHEAVILNEHLTKALRMIKKDSEGETVDKMLITNLLLSFLSFPRGDAKKFEVLQLISNCLGWDEDQKGQAGLARQHSVNSSVSRSQSSNSLTAHMEDSSSAGRFMGLFAEFLERESGKRNGSV